MRWVNLVLIASAAPVAAAAHHSTQAFYDRDASVELEGTVESVTWRNPHVGLTLLVRNEQGEQEQWVLEGGAMNTLRRRGFTEDSVTAGDYVRVAGAPSNRGAKAIFVTNFLLPSGTEVLFTDRVTPLLWTEVGGETLKGAVSTAGSLTAGLEPAPDIFRVWLPGGRYYLDKPLELTQKALTARRSWDPAVDDPALRCEAPGMPNAILNPYPIEIIDEGQQIRLRIEEWDGVRLIHLDEANVPEDFAPDRLGYSTGHWEGNTLIVRTSHVSWPYLDDSGTPMSDDVRMLEHFTLRPEQGKLEYQISVTDPENLETPAVWKTAWIWDPAVSVRPYECTTG